MSVKAIADNNLLSIDLLLEVIVNVGPYDLFLETTAGVGQLSHAPLVKATVLSSMAPSDKANLYLLGLLGSYRGINTSK